MEHDGAHLIFLQETTIFVTDLLVSAIIPMVTTHICNVEDENFKKNGIRPLNVNQGDRVEETAGE